ncbi:MAG: hypothetical protein Q9182_004128 [Xanthomendoza sp. 2 TL-2023]
MTEGVHENTHAFPEDVLCPRPPLVSGISDYTLSLIIPIVVHWSTAAVYEIFLHYGIFEKFRIHTSEEEKAKNTISKLECLRGVLLVQILQTGLGILLGLSSEVEMTGYEDREIAAWATCLQTFWQASLALLTITGINFEALANTFSRSMNSKTSFSSSAGGHNVDLILAKLVYYILIPGIRQYAALWLADTWVFFIHRAEHSNKWLYKTFHARHHELYVPYSWGGIYDHPVESMFLSVGAFVVAIMGTGMSLRESMVFSAYSSAKACTDHSGYKFPWNPIDLVTTVGAEYHDKHHQRWGFKNNFALHFQFWDRMLGTNFADDEAASRFYKRDRDSAATQIVAKAERKKAEITSWLDLQFLSPLFYRFVFERVKKDALPRSGSPNALPVHPSSDDPSTLLESQSPETSQGPSHSPAAFPCQTPALRSGSLILVTGVNGYIGSHIAYELLLRGYHVRGTVRDKHKGVYMSKCFAGLGLLWGTKREEGERERGEEKGKEKMVGAHVVEGKERDAEPGKKEEMFEVVVVEDMAAKGAFDGVVEGCSAIIHVATDLSLNHDPNAVIPPMICGVQNALRAAMCSPAVKRFIYTSSSAACTAPIANKRFHVTDQTWNDADVELAWAPPPYTDDRRLAVYAASKTIAEKECWRFMREENPSFVLNTILPNCNIGRILCKEQPASTGGWYKRLWDGGDASALHLLREEFPPQHWVNVTDTALLHVAALLEGDVQGERILAFAGPFNWNDTVEALERIDAEGGDEGWRWRAEDKRGRRKWEKREGCERDLKTVETGRGEELLRRYGRDGFRGLEESLRECVGSF